ncbi:MAG: hypothetical protein ACRD6X_21045 [Pyrinomonadaceae bacterium]
MSTLNLNLILSVKNANGPESIGGVFGLPVQVFNVPGGPWQPLVHADSVANAMVVGDELKEAVFRQQLQILRDSDAHTIDVYQAYQAGKKFVVIANVVVKDSTGAISTSATITITEAKIKHFKRKKIGGFLAPKHRDDILFSYASGNTKIEYGSNINAVAARELGKTLTAVNGTSR